MRIVFAALFALAVALIVEYIVIRIQDRRDREEPVMTDIAAVTASPTLGEVKAVKVMARTSLQAEEDTEEDADQVPTDLPPVGEA